MNISGTGRAGHLIEVLRAAVRSSVRWLVRGLAALLALLFLYLALALGGSLLPSNASWSPPQQGVSIFIYTNGVHSGIVLPAANDLQDWRHWVKAEDIRDPRYAASSHILFGWGERGFYLNTPRWSDLRPGVAARALLGGNGTLLHVDHVHAPRPSSDMRPLMISEDQYRELVRRIAGYFRLDAKGRVQPIMGYGPADVFYESNGRYGPFHTCNEWTGAQLRGIGVRVGVWTPFSRSVMRWFDETP
jgi:uncharacterized protein (TIGR02117 family)